jgi:hypothetical protein
MMCSSQPPTERRHGEVRYRTEGRKGAAIAGGGGGDTAACSFLSAVICSRIHAIESSAPQVIGCFAVSWTCHNPTNNLAPCRAVPSASFPSTPWA